MARKPPRAGHFDYHYSTFFSRRSLKSVKCTTPGGIVQDIYEDPHGVDVDLIIPCAALCTRLIAQTDITGHQPPHPPISA